MLDELCQRLTMIIKIFKFILYMRLLNLLRFWLCELVSALLISFLLV